MLANNELYFDVQHYNFLSWKKNKFDDFKYALQLRIEATLGYGRNRNFL